MQPFSSTAIAVLLTVIIGFAVILIVEMMRQKPRRPQPRRSVSPPAAQTQAAAPNTGELAPQMKESFPQAAAPAPPTEAPTPQTAQTGSILETRSQPLTLIKPVSPLVSIGKSILIIAGFAAMAFLLLIALPQSWFEGILKRLPGNYYVSVTSGESLWLEDLSEEKSAEQLRVTGKVRNVSPGELRSPQVVIKVFGFDNAVMGTVAAPLREYYLAVQAQSDFAVAYQVDASKILRYTVIFQQPDGTALMHKDVRGKP